MVLDRQRWKYICPFDLDQNSQIDKVRREVIRTFVITNSSNSCKYLNLEYRHTK